MKSCKVTALKLPLHLIIKIYNSSGCKLLRDHKRMLQLRW